MASDSRGLVRAARAALEQGKFVEGERLARQACAANPMDGSAVHVLGASLLELGRHAEALGWLRRAAGFVPSDVDTLLWLAKCLRRCGLAAEAESVAARVLQLKPGNGEAMLQLGGAIVERGDAAGGIEIIRKAVAALPRSAPARLELARALLRNGDLGAAATESMVALDLKPHDGRIRAECIEILCDAGRHDAAFEIAESVPAAPGANLRGVIRIRQGRPELAAEEFRSAVETDPKSHGSWVNLGNALRATFSFEEACACYGRAAELLPGDEGAAVRRTHGEMLMLLGDYPRGFRAFESRWHTGDPLLPVPNFGVPQWNGEDISAKTILLHSEQGFGDAIQFARFVPMVARLAARVILDCYPALGGLFESVEGVAQVVERGEALPKFDVHCPLMSLPVPLGITLENLPRAVPYLRVNDDAVVAWRESLGDGNALRVGLVWASGAASAGREYRTVPIDTLRPFASVPGVRWYSLQTGDAAKQLEGNSAGFPIRDLSKELGDFADTAAAMQAMDLVITVDTASAHLAGALGVPVWTLLARVGEWRWPFDQESCPWYPTMRLFWQKEFGDWSGVIERVAAALRTMASERA